ncbi:MAG: CBS domain-containing protein [Verrucomicrobiales bacterium]
MTRNPEYITPETTLQEAAKRMRDLDVGLLPVGDGSKVKGMLTDRDITVRATARAWDPKSGVAGEVMTPEVVYAYEDQELEEAIQIMEDNKIRRLIILDRDRNMAGIVALADLAVLTEEADQKAEVLEAVSR